MTWQQQRMVAEAGAFAVPSGQGKAVWILNVLVDATRHHGETETADQNNGLVDLNSRKGQR